MKTTFGFRLLEMVVMCALAITGLTAAVAAQVNVLTQHNDNARTGANLNESLLTPSNVTVSQFGMLFKKTVDDQVYAQPLYVSNVSIAGGIHNVVYLATVNNSVYAFDADNGTQLWHVNFGTPQNIADGGWSCTDVTGNMGIIGTPVIDASSQTLYVVARTNEGGSFFQRLHALDITTGADKTGSPVEVTTSGFSELMQNQRPALLLANGIVYVGEGSHCDVGPYKGYVFGFNATTLAKVGVFNPEPGSDGASLWQTGQGPAADASGNVYFITSNGTWDGVSNFSDSFIKLTPNLGLADWFTPSDHATLSGGDTDINASGAALIPGTNLVVGGGKQGKMYVLNTANMGHLGSSNALQIFQATSGGQFQSSAVSWQSAANGTLVYIWGVNDALKAFKVSNGLLQTTPFATGPITQSYPGGRLSISASGSSNGIVWAYTAPANQEHSSGPGVLRAYNADNISTELWNSTQNSSRDSCNNISKNAAPTIANGKVYLPSFGTANSGSGQLCVYGLLAGSPDFSLSATPASQTVTPGSGTSYTATVSALSGFSGSVLLGVSGLPSGATASFNPASISGAGTSTLSVSTSSSTPAGTYTLTITGTSGSLTHSASVALVVTPVSGTPVYQINSGGPAVVPFAADAFFSGGQTDTVTTAINTSGVTNSAPMAVYQSERWGGDSASNPAPFSYTFTKLTAGASYTVRLHFAEIFWTAAGQRQFNVAINGTPVLTNFDIIAAAGAANKAIVKEFTAVANSSGNIVVSYTVGAADAPKSSGIEIVTATPPAPDFTLSATPGSQTVVAGNNASYSATVSEINGFTGSVALSVSGVPAGATASFSPSSVSGAGSSTLTIASGTAAAGTYPLTITGSSGTLAHSASVTLVINPQPVPDFTLTASPSSQNVTVGNSTSYTATVTAVNGFAGSVALNVSGVPAGATATFNPASVTGSGTSSLTIATGTAAAGTYPLTITGSSGTLTHSASVTLMVNPVSNTPVYQINSGGPAVTPFAADAFFSGGQTDTVTTAISTSGVTNPAPMAVYQSERWGGDSASNPAPFSYTFPNLTAGASYTVRLHFAEIFWTTAGQRKFNVAINGTQVL
ncbi:MAG TPA: malectin domain-containing carbohydrate-binding protein, partial [Candidatus Angelobacter sp.]|nr:malectin domain-containing carbohydrate-binding protein [Candidatus Angelobacter sp.]